MQKIVQLSPALHETSGLAEIDGQLFTINDSGDTSRVYKFNTNGELLDSYVLSGAINRDWEALCSNNDTLFIGDIGNNFKWKDTLVIYMSKNQNLIGEIRFSYPDGKRYDCESMIFYHDTLILFTKNRKDGKSYLYGIPAQSGFHKATLLDSIPFKGKITGADFNESSGTLLLVGYRNFHPFIMVYDFCNPIQISHFDYRKRAFPFRPARQTEAILIKEKGQAWITSEKFWFRKGYLFEVRY
jgi:hypothetical protein